VKSVSVIANPDFSKSSILTCRPAAQDRMMSHAAYRQELIAHLNPNLNALILIKRRTP